MRRSKHAVAAFGAEDEAALDQLGHDVDGAGASSMARAVAEGRIMAHVAHGAVGVVQQFGLVGLGLGGKRR